MRTQATSAEKESKYFYLFLALVFILPLWPNYAEFKFGGIPNLAPDRLLRVALFFGFIGIFFTNSVPVKVMKQRLAKNWILVFMLSVFYGMRILSALVSPNTAFQLYAFFRNEFLVSFPFFCYALLAIKDEKSVKKILVTLVISGFFASIVALVDYYNQKNLFMGLVPANSDYLMGVFLDKTRDDSYRAQGTFEHPIMLGQFFVLLLPIIWTLLRQSNKFTHVVFYTTTAGLALAAIYASGSRAALGLGLVVISLFIFWEIYAWTKTSRNRVLQYLVISQIPIPIVGVLTVLYAYKGVALGKTQEALSSTNARIDMLIGGGPKIFDSPIYGHGLGEALSVFSLVGRAGLRTLDNYYLLLGLETGVICLLVFFFLLIVPCLKLAKSSLDIENISSRLLIAFSLILLAYVVQMAIHSLHQQIWFIILVLACNIAILGQPLKTKKSLATTKSTKNQELHLRDAK